MTHKLGSAVAVGDSQSKSMIIETKTTKLTCEWKVDGQRASDCRVESEFEARIIVPMGSEDKLDRIRSPQFFRCDLPLLSHQMLSREAVGLHPLLKLSIGGKIWGEYIADLLVA